MTFPNFSFTQQAYTRGPGTSGTFWPIISDRNPTAADVFFGSLTYNVGQLWFNTVLESMWILDSFTNVKTASNPAGQAQARWVDFITNNSQLLSLSDNANTQVFPSLTTDVPPSNIQIEGQLNQQVTAFATTVANVSGHIIKTNPMSVARWIVDPLSTTANPNGTHTSISDAISAASSGDTIFIMPGTYTETIVLKAGVNLTAFDCDSMRPNVTIVGKVTLATAGTVCISGIRFQTSGAVAIEVSGSSASVLVLKGCYINCTNFNGISFTSSSGSSSIALLSCFGNVATTGITLFTSSSAGVLTFEFCYFGNSGSTVTNSTISAGGLYIFGCGFNIPITTSGTNGLIGVQNSIISTDFGSGTVCFTVGGSGTNFIQNSNFQSAAATALTISSTCTVSTCSITTTNVTAAINGGGTIKYAGLDFPSLGFLVTTTTQTPFNSGPVIGLSPVSGSLAVRVMCGNGSPNAVITAPIGSIYSRTDASSATTRVYVNTDGATAWTNVTCAA